MDDTDIRKLIERNKRVEAEKAWETSITRRCFIALFTYVIAFIYMKQVNLGNPALGAFVPSGGYLLSTLSIPFAKSFWLNNLYKKQESSNDH